jgi:hypothetical protein
MKSIKKVQEDSNKMNSEINAIIENSADNNQNIHILSKQMNVI